MDLDEAERVGRHAVEIALTEGTGHMATIKRDPGGVYSVSFGRASLAEMAGPERRFPETWIAKSGYDVTDDFIGYARPLIGDANPRIPFENGLPRFARLKRRVVEKRCADYVPQAYREDEE